MDSGDSRSAPGVPNHPLAVRMGIVAALSHNILIGTVFGTAGVFLGPMQDRLGVTPEMSAAGVPMVILGSSILASVAGVLAARFSLRSLMAGSAALAALAWILLALTHSYAVYIIAFGVLLGPAMSLAGAVLPPTLVTRWFNRNRGLAIGLVHLPVVVTVLPVVTNWVIGQYGLTAALLLLAGLCGLVLLPAALLVIDHPPGETARDAADIATQSQTERRAMGMGQLLRLPAFWALALAVSAINSSSTLLGVHLVTMAETWGFTRNSGAILASTMSLGGIAGSIVFGLIADRLGGARTLALIAFDAGLLWLAFLAGLPFVPLLIVVALIGMHGSGAIPSISRALADSVGTENFSRAYGLASTINLPFVVLGVLGMAAVYRLHGNYHLAIAVMVGCFAGAILLALYAGRRRNRGASIPA